MSLVKELSRRNVFRVMAAFLVFGWLLLQVANALEESLGLPEWFDAMVIALLALGFPIAIVLSWVYELTPEGLKKSADVDLDNEETRRTAKRLDYATLAGVVLVLGTFFAGRFMPASAPASAPVAAAAAVAAAEQPAESRVIDKSIAVLPFVAMSTSPDDEFFADGLSEELLNVLAKVPSLKVAGRTSSFYYKGKNEPLSEIASALGVAHVLEGSVRRSGNTLRVTAQLIEAEGGFHLWSETYDREDGDVFKIQDNIAGSVVAQLQAQLLGDPAPVADDRNPEAESLFLIAQAKLNRRTLQEIRRARTMFAEASTLVPDDPRFLAGYAHATAILYWNHRAISAKEVIPEASGAIEKALTLGTPSADTLAIAGLVEELRVLVDADSQAKARALDYYQQALAKEPNNILAMQWLATIYMDLNRPDEALDYFERVVELDPLNELAMAGLGSVYVRLGEREKAKSHLIKMKSLFAEQPMTSRYLAGVEDQLGRADKAAYWSRAEFGKDGSTVALFGLLRHLMRFGWQDEARELIASFEEETKTDLSPMYEAFWQRDFDSAALASLDLFEQTGAGFYAETAAWAYAMDDQHRKARDILKKQFPSLQGEVPEYLDFSDFNDALLLAYCEAKLGNKAESMRLANLLLSSDSLSDEVIATNPFTVREYRMIARELVGDRDGALEDLRAILANNEVVNGAALDMPITNMPLYRSLAETPELQQLSRDHATRLAQQARKLASGETEKEIYAEFVAAGYPLDAKRAGEPAGN